MTLNALSLSRLSCLMKEALLPARELDSHETLQRLGQWALESSPLWDFVIASKGDVILPLHTAVVTGALWRESIYSGLAEITDPSSKTRLSPSDLSQALETTWLPEWVGLYRGNDVYIASFDLVVLQGRHVYRYLLPEDCFLYLCETHSTEEVAWVCAPVISVIRSFIVGGLGGYAKALLSAGGFLRQGINLAEPHDFELEIRMDGRVELWLGIVGTPYFSAPAYLCPAGVDLPAASEEEHVK